MSDELSSLHKSAKSYRNYYNIAQFVLTLSGKE